MHRPRQVLLCTVFFFVFLLPCVEVCLGIGHVHGMSTGAVATRPGSEHRRCDSSPAAHQKTPGSCADCVGHVFLAPASPDVTTRAALGSALSPLCLVTPLRAPFSKEHAVIRAVRAGNASPHRILAPVVLRL